jgi:DNA mismatch endonuclease (patch repair protein)
MPEKLSPEERSKAMKAVKTRGTSLERQLWSMLAGMGLSKWRRNAKDVHGTPDVVFDEAKVAIFVDGCFWHKCPICDRSSPETHSEYWENKFLRNIEHDKEINKLLINSGWKVLRIWEHEMKSPKSRASIRHQLISIFFHEKSDQ